MTDSVSLYCQFFQVVLWKTTQSITDMFIQFWRNYLIFISLTIPVLLLYMELLWIHMKIARGFQIYFSLELSNWINSYGWVTLLTIDLLVLSKLVSSAFPFYQDVSFKWNSLFCCIISYVNVKSCEPLSVPPRLVFAAIIQPRLVWVDIFLVVVSNCGFPFKFTVYVILSIPSRRWHIWCIQNLFDTGEWI